MARIRVERQKGYHTFLLMTARCLVRHYTWLSFAILALACFNLTFRLGREPVGEWDESLYATSAWEMTRTGDLVGTTFDGTLDYYNSKPPLNVWIIATAFSLFGVGLLSLRLSSAVFGWLTVWVLQRWTRRAFGPAVSLFSSLALASTFGFLHQHSARSGNADALLTLLILLLVVVIWSARDDPWRRVWLGPILAGVFLLKGAALLQPLLLVMIVEAVARRSAAPASRWPPLVAAAAVFMLPVGAWVMVRWRLDGWQFFEQMVNYDLLALSLTALEGHDHGPFYYFDVLQKYQYDWLGGGGVVAIVARRSWRAWIREFVVSLRAREPLSVLMVAWAAVTFVVPTLLQTRTPWYLNAFYPLFAVLVGLVLARGLEAQGVGSRGRTIVVATAVGLALVVAESKSLWRLYRVTNLDTSVQGLLLTQVRDGGGQRVFRDRRVRSEAFVVRALRHAEFRVVDVAGARPPDARTGDLVVAAGERSIAGLRLLGRAAGDSVYQVE